MATHNLCKKANELTLSRLVLLFGHVRRLQTPSGDITKSRDIVYFIRKKKSHKKAGFRVKKTRACVRKWGDVLLWVKGGLALCYNMLTEKPSCFSPKSNALIVW